jgi:hypothetical protein
MNARPVEPEYAKGPGKPEESREEFSGHEDILKKLFYAFLSAKKAFPIIAATEFAALLEKGH